MTKKLTEQRQAEIREEGKKTFQAGTSSNPYKEGTHSHALFLDGWLEAKHECYNGIAKEASDSLAKLTGFKRFK